MKGIYYIIITLISINSFGQIPQKMNYQMVVTNINNQILSNQNVGIKISVLQGSISGNAVYAETHALSTNNDGLVNFDIGAGTVIFGNFSTIDWMNGPYFLKSETDPLGGTNYSITATSELLSTPYSLFAGNGFGKTSLIGDTLFYGNGQFILIPGISSANPPIHPGSACNLTGILNPALTYDTIMDIDGNTYKTIVIGTQEWMAENLRTTRYRNGDNIHHIVDQTHWNEMTEGAWCLNNNNNNNKCPFGNLYNKYAAEDSRKVCPVGWRIPHDTDLTVLSNYLGVNPASKTKSNNPMYWWNLDSLATNSSGLSIIGSDARYNSFDNGTPEMFEFKMWLASPIAPGLANDSFGFWWHEVLIYAEDEDDKSGISIRCIKE